jgi:hypothetical protein
MFVCSVLVLICWGDSSPVTWEATKQACIHITILVTSRLYQTLSIWTEKCGQNNLTDRVVPVLEMLKVLHVCVPMCVISQWENAAALRRRRNANKLKSENSSLFRLNSCNDNTECLCTRLLVHPPYIHNTMTSSCASHRHGIYRRWLWIELSYITYRWQSNCFLLTLETI